MRAVLLLPPYLYEGMKKARIMPTAKYPRLAAELGTSSILTISIGDLWYLTTDSLQLS